MRFISTSILTVLFAVSLATAQKKGSSQCVRPTVAPPPTSCPSGFGSGCLDTSFTGVGFAVYEQLGRIHHVTTDPNGGIVAVGDGARSTTSATGTDVLFMKFNPDGSRDTNFGEVDISNPLQKTGQAYVAVTAGTEFVKAGAVTPEGKILAAGWASGIWWVVRMNADGTPDTGFDGDGILTLSRSGGVWEMKVQPDGKILLGSDTNFTVTRLNEDGSLDPTFGAGGTVSYNAGSKSGSSRLWSITFQRLAATPDEDRIIVSGWSNSSANGTTSFALMRLRSNGIVDTSFGSSGKVTTSFFNTSNQARRVAIDSSNRIVAAGITNINSCSASDFAIARYTENGALDTTFGTGGKASLDLYNDENSIYALAVQSDGKMVVGGNARVLATDAVNRRYYFTLVRYDASGNLDSSFGSGTAGPGIVTTELTGASASSFIFALHQQADGAIIAAGTSIEKPAIARYLP